ncbi:MAG TPA: PH domain-containing protein [Phycisphaerae bacterium]|nr:PH domain-containing protein [Phycisphaerae bacterium]
MAATDGRQYEVVSAQCPTQGSVPTLPAVGTTGANAGNAPIASADLLPAHLLGGDEIIILAVKPSLWFVLFQSFRWVAAMALAVWFVGWFGHLTPFLKTPLVVNAAVAIAAARVGLAMMQWVSRLYVLTNRRVLRIKGIFNIDLFECPLVKVQNTYLTLTWYERLFGLGSITFATAGTAGFEPAWINVNQPLEVHEQVRAAIHKAQRPNANGV